ncbi:MAG: hypothetical protein EOO08_12210 [Chitinophagaceae bacterium]|nr:MAG: hypothetical protein EOO08_12210 [Chitinophagaceae bacterium]
MTSSNHLEDKDKVPFRFHFFEIKFTPYKEVTNKHSGNIIYDVAVYLNKEQRDGKGILAERHEGRKDTVSRPLFVTNCYFMLKEKIIVGSIALLRKGKVPKLKPAETYKLIELDVSKGQIAEETHFFIDYSTSKVIMCVEYNHEGPRDSDLEFYLRVIARDKLNLARATDVDMFMDVPVDKALAELKNVLQFEIKIQPGNLKAVDTEARNSYLSGMTHMGNIYNPKFLKVEALFQTPGKQYESSELNVHGNAMAKKFLTLFKEKPVNVDLFDNFVIRYQTEDGREESFNLVKGKKEVIKHVNPSTLNGGRAWYDLIKDDFSAFVETFR